VQGFLYQDGLRLVAELDGNNNGNCSTPLTNLLDSEG
jgi:hypothetical protein